MAEKHEQCNREFEWGVVKTSIAETKADIADIRTDQKEILKRIDGLPVRLKAQDKSIGRLWKIVLVALASAGAAIAAALRNQLP